MTGTYMYRSPSSGPAIPTSDLDMEILKRHGIVRDTGGCYEFGGPPGIDRVIVPIDGARLLEIAYEGVREDGDIYHLTEWDEADDSDSGDEMEISGIPELALIIYDKFESI